MPDADDDHDSPVDSNPSSNETISSSEIPNYFQTKHGRQFHVNKSAIYFLPSDAEEFRRLNAQHYMFQSLLGNRNTFGPVATVLDAEPHDTKRVLDLGTGSGIWVEAMAQDEYPYDVSFTGVDLVPIETQIAHTRFECYNLSDGIHGEGPIFDVIHARQLSFGYRGYAQLAQQAFQKLNAGGLFLSIEIDIRPSAQRGVVPPSTLTLLERAVRHAQSVAGEEGYDPTKIPEHLRQAGFEEVDEDMQEVPIGGWMAGREQLGEQAREVTAGLADALRPALLDGGADETELDNLLSVVRAEILETTGWSAPCYLVHARKPPGAPAAP